MLVVADTSPISTLVQIQHVDILPQLFGRVFIPSAVLHELSHVQAPEAIRLFVQEMPTWLEVRDPTKVDRIAALDPGEEAAISLACELSADLLLIDERDGREAARQRGLSVVGTLGILERAALAELLDLEIAAERLRDPIFRVADDLIQEVLERHRKRREGG